MDRLERPATAGLLASVLTALAVLVPYALPGIDGRAVETYYGYGLLGGWSVLIVALVAVVVFAAGRQRRSDPATAAGAGLSLGVVATVLAAAWAFQVPRSVVTQVETHSLFVYHRWVLVAASIAIVLAGAWYASTRNLV